MEQWHDGEDAVAFVRRDDLELAELEALRYYVVVGELCEEVSVRQVGAITHVFQETQRKKKGGRHIP